MVFIRKKKIGKKIYYYLVMNVREGRKVRQKVISYLGTSEKVVKIFGGKK